MVATHRTHPTSAFLGLVANIALVMVMCLLSVTPAAGQVINEILASNQLGNADEDGDTSDWVEFYNPTDSYVDLTGFSLTDDRADLQKWTFPETILQPRSHFLVWCSGKNRLEVPPERLTERNSPLPFNANLVTLDDEWRYLTGAPEDPGPPADWAAPDFDDSSWPTGKPGFGFNRNNDLRTPWPSGLGAGFLRREFEFQPGQRNLILQTRFDDGIVVYLNGVRVATSRYDEPAEPTFASTATGSHSATIVERLDLTSSIDLLKPGTNVLAICVLNVRPTSIDLILYAELGTVPPTYHTNFRIRSAGDSVLLVDPNGVVQDEIDLPPQAPDQSYGRSPDGEGPFLYHLAPSPGAANEGPTSAEPLLVGDTKFSVDRGFYAEPFDVEITTTTEAAAIRYTTDGSEPTEANGMDYTGPIRVEHTTTLRARAFKPDHRPTNVDTQTYIFLDDVVAQSRQSAEAAGFPRAWRGVLADYDMDTDVIGPNDRFGGVYAASIRDDLLSLPTVSVVMNVDDMFGAERGIYANPTREGVAWERPASLEYFTPDGTREFQLSCGVRIQGGYFRNANATRKHSLRFLFKREYGPTKLRFPLFGDGAVDSFDTITMRAGSNDGYSWDAARLTEQYTRDEFGRSLQLATGNAGGHGTFVHLYINGLYWGLYNPVERPDRSFSASYYGGDKDEWDAIHDGNASYGDTVAWNRMVQLTASARASAAAYQELQGRNPDGSPNPDLPHYLDVPNYVDYLIVNLWGGNWDWPWKNWWAGRDRSANSTGFKFYCWDYENTMGNNRGRSPLNKNALQNNFSSAGVPHTNLRSNPEYRRLFGDRIHRLFFNGGPLTPESLIPRYEALAASVERSIVGESARWGDQHHHPPLGLTEWRRERDWLLNQYLPQRTGIVLQQLRSAGLYPPIAAPEFFPSGGMVDKGTRVQVRPSGGTIYYTTDGSDPRLPDGAVSPSATEANAGERFALLPEGSEARILVPSDDSFGDSWLDRDFDDSGWLSGPAPVGFETRQGYEEIIATDVRELMYEVNASIYLRFEFTVDDPEDLSFLTLRMRVDDGFVAYINGERVASRGEPQTLTWNSRARTSNSDSRARVFEDFELGDAGAVLQAGRNVLAIHGLNLRDSDGDFLMEPELVAFDTRQTGFTIEETVLIQSRTWTDGEWSALNESPFVVDTDIPLRVTEIMYHPAPPDTLRYDAEEFEFIELQNVGVKPLELADVRLSGGVEFDFSTSGIESLEPGEHVVLVENLNAFRSRYDDSGMTIAGEYRGRLSNGGDPLVLEGFLDEPILAFSYRDDWFAETDGAGYSLVVVDPLAARDEWSKKDNWMYSLEIGGSPGENDEMSLDLGGERQPGDIDQDGRRSVSDALRLLLILFDDTPRALPCDGAISEGGNLTLIDVNGDGGANAGDAIYLLSYLFRRGPAPVLGTDCVRIRGCGEGKCR